MILETFDKQPHERKDYDVDFIDWLPQGDTLAGCTATVANISGGTDTSLTVERIDVSDSRVKLWVSGGIDKQRYKVTLLSETTNLPLSRIDESEVVFNIKDT